MPLSLTYRQATTADLHYLLWLRKQTMHDYLLASGLAADDASHLQRIKYKFEGAKLIFLNAQQIGLLKTAEHPESIELIQIQVAPEHQGKGLGRRIIGAVLAEAQAKNVSVTLSVLKTNPAKKLYRSMGFEVVEENSHSYNMKYSV